MIMLYVNMYRVMLFLFDGDLRGAVAVFLEGGVLPGVAFVAILQFVEESLAQHPFALAMDEDDAGAAFLLVVFQRAAEDVELVVEDVGGAHAGGVVEQGIDVQVDNERRISRLCHFFLSRMCFLLSLRVEG